MPEKSEKRKLVVTSQNQIASGTSKETGDDWTIYEVWAVDSNGTPVQVALRSFADLTPHFGKEMEYGVKKHTSEKYGTTYTVSLPKGKGGAGGLGAKVDELREQLGLLTARVADLEAGKSGSQSQARPTPGANAGTGPPATAPATNDDDIPF